MRRVLAIVYRVVANAVFFLSFLYAIGFVENAPVPKAIDTGPDAPFGQALLIDAALLGLSVAVQRRNRARSGFPPWWTRVVPGPVQRRTHVLVAGLALALLCWQWRPLPGLLWDVDDGAAQAILLGLNGGAWLIVLVSAFAIGPFDLFGLCQVGLDVRGKEDRTPAFYRIVRDPLYPGLLVALWATPRMTVGRLVFAVATTGYVVLASQLEERDRGTPRTRRTPGRRLDATLDGPEPGKG